GGWTYMEKGADLVTILPLTVLNAVSQSFFMGMFFFIGAYFTHLSFQKKGLLKFSRERLIRLGIPLVLTFFFISVLTTYIALPAKNPRYANISFPELWNGGRAFGFGVMWFVLALCYFTFLYLIAYWLIPALRKKERKPLPKIKTHYVLISSILVGLATFLVRIKYPLFKGNGISWLPFDLGHFPQYIFLFIFGVVAARYNSDSFVTFKQAKRWACIVAALTFIVFPFMFFIGKAHINGIQSFAGRGTWHSLAYALWEQIIGFSIMIALMGILKAKWNYQSRFAQKLSNSAYGVYALHPPVLVGISVLFINWKTILLVKFLVLTPLAVAGSFGIALLVKQMPLLRKIF
ncbi:acyltransferase family protein, partial [Draconibacterium sp.]|nr:acyltransferase family protein [Draconibacterium sp.]